MNSSDSSLNTIDEIAEDFVARYRRGERPAVADYTARHPEHAAEIAAILPALVAMEDLKPSRDRSGDGRFAEEDTAPTARQLGDYRIVREIGRGGMGIVYEAVQESLARRVALKVLPQQLIANASREGRFEREARAAAKLHHTNIVPVFGVGIDEGVHYYAMQYIHGLGLDEVLRELRQPLTAKHEQPSANDNCPVTLPEVQPRQALSVAVTQALITGEFETVEVEEQVRPNVAGDQGKSATNATVRHFDTHLGRISDTVRLSDSLSLSSMKSLRPGDQRSSYWQSTARLGVQVGEALQYAHEQGVLHRDIKPSNLLLDTRGTVWITDFGLAKADDQQNLTQTGDVLGTLRYMAPEMFSGRSDARSDVYSLGLTLYELLALRPAFSETDRGRLIRMVLHESPPRLRTLDPAIPRDLETIVHKAIEREPSERYQSAGELAADLERFVADEPIHAKRLPRLSLLIRWCRRNRLVAGLAGLVGLLIAATTVSSLVAATRSQALAERTQALAERTTESLKKERKARRENQQQLFETGLAQARASRLSGRPGQRLEALTAVRTGAGLLEPLGLGEDERRALRTEAISALALVDLKKQRSWGGLAMSSDVTISDGFEWFACATADGKSVQLRRVGSPTEIRGTIETLLTPNHHALRFAPDGKRLWAFDWAEQTVRLFDCSKRREIAKMSVQLSVGPYAIARHPTQSRVIIGDIHGALRMWDLDTAKMTDFATGEVCVLAASYSANGQRLAVSRADGNLEIRNAETGKVERTWPGMGGSRVIAWRSDGAFLAVGQGQDIHIIELREPSYDEYFVCRGHQSEVVSLLFHPNEPLLVSSSWDGTTRIWDACRGIELIRQVGQILQFDNAGQLLALRPGTTVELWELKSPEGQYWLDQQKVGGIAVHPKLPLLAAAYTDGVRLWDFESRRFLAHLPIGGTSEVSFQPRTGRLLTAGQSGVWAWPVEAKERHVQFGPPSVISTATKATRAVHSSGDERMLLTEGHNRHDASLIDLREKAATLHDISKRGLIHTALSTDGRWAAAANTSQKVSVWDVKSSKLIHELPCSGVGPLRFSPNSRWLLANSGQAISFWKVGAWELAHEIPLETSGGSGIAFSPDSRIVATGQWGSGLRLYDLESAELIANLELPENPPAYVDLEFSPDGGLLMAAADVEGLCVWDLRTLRRRLVELGLDWDQKPLPKVTMPASQPLKIQADLGSLAGENDKP